MVLLALALAQSQLPPCRSGAADCEPLERGLRRIGEDDWVDVGTGSKGELWSLQTLSAINMQQDRKNYSFGPRHAWIRIIPKGGRAAFSKVYWAISCSDKGYFTISRVIFSRSGEQLSRWDNPRSTAPRAFPTWSYAAPGTIEWKVIEAACS